MAEVRFLGAGRSGVLNGQMVVAINILRKMRQMGSLFAPFVFLAALIGAPFGDAGTDLYRGSSDHLDKHPFPDSATRSEKSRSDFFEPYLVNQHFPKICSMPMLRPTPAPSPTPPVPTEDIGKTWTDRRPIGKLTLAQIESISDTNLNGWMNGGPVNLGTTAFQKDILSRVNNTIQNTSKMHGQGLLIWDIAGCGKSTPALPSQEYLGDPRFLDPKGAGLTVRTAYSPYVPPASKLGQQGLEPAMNAIADQIFSAVRAAGLIPGVCLRAQRVTVNSAGDLDGTAGHGGLRYDTTANQLADIDAKLTYAHNRWGCRIFYIDSNVASEDVYSAQRAQNNPTFAPAWVYTQLRLRHPDCLICPEQAYPGAFQSSRLGINDPAYQYSRTTARYTELRNPWQGPWISSDESAAVPEAFTLINVADRGATDPAEKVQVLNALQANQCILLSDAWAEGDGITLVINFQKAAGVNGF